MLHNLSFVSEAEETKKKQRINNFFLNSIDT
jgi:hypothetical protein